MNRSGKGIAAIVDSSQKWSLYNEFAEQAFLKDAYEVAHVLLGLALNEAVSFGESDSRYISTIEHLGDVLAALGNWRGANEHYSKSVEILERQPEQSPLDLIPYRKKQAEVLVQLGEYANAERLLQELIVTLEGVFGKGHDFTAEIEESIASIKSKQKSFTSASKLSQKIRTTRSPID